MYMYIYTYVPVYMMSPALSPFQVDDVKMTMEDNVQQMLHLSSRLLTHTHTHTHADTHVNQQGFRTKVHLLSSHFPPVRWTT